MRARVHVSPRLERGHCAPRAFSSGEPLDDLHWSATLRAAIKSRSVFGGGSVVLHLRLWSCAQQLGAKRQKLGTPAVSQKAEMSDALVLNGEPPDEK